MSAGMDQGLTQTPLPLSQGLTRTPLGTPAQEPLPVARLEPWWRVAVVNIGESPGGTWRWHNPGASHWPGTRPWGVECQCVDE